MIRFGAERLADELFAPIDAVLHSPQASAVGFDQQVESAAVEQLDGFFRRLDVANGRRSAAASGGTGFGPEGGYPQLYPPLWSAVNGSLKIFADQETLGKQVFCSVLWMSLDHLGSRDGSPGRTRTSDQRINSPSLYH